MDLQIGLFLQNLNQEVGKCVGGSLPRLWFTFGGRTTPTKALGKVIGNDHTDLLVGSNIFHDCQFA